MSPDRYAQLIERIRNHYPDMSISTDIIVGFPGEGILEFEDSLRFVGQMRFSGGHVFTYSSRPGTRAASFREQVHPADRKERNQRMRELITSSSHRYASGQLGKTVSVLWESLCALDASGWTLMGRSAENLQVRAPGTPNDLNQIRKVQLTSLAEQATAYGQMS
jgi:threonylcarbamoyladenosine tRNA methylthiotransferase MtaB